MELKPPSLLPFRSPADHQSNQLLYKKTSAAIQTPPDYELTRRGEEANLVFVLLFLMICFSCNSVPFLLISTKPASPGSHIHVQPLTSHECHFFCCHLRSLLTCWITAAALRSLPTLHPSPASSQAQDLSLLAPSPGLTTSDFK